MSKKKRLGRGLQEAMRMNNPEFAPENSAEMEGKPKPGSRVLADLPQEPAPLPQAEENVVPGQNVEVVQKAKVAQNAEAEQNAAQNAAMEPSNLHDVDAESFEEVLDRTEERWGMLESEMKTLEDFFGSEDILSTSLGENPEWEGAAKNQRVGAEPNEEILEGAFLEGEPLERAIVDGEIPPRVLADADAEAEAKTKTGGEKEEETPEPPKDDAKKKKIVSKTGGKKGEIPLENAETIYRIPVALIDSNPWQPREYFEAKEIRELAASINEHGLLQPIVVRRDRERFQLVAGERRFRAAIKLNWTQIPAKIVEASDREMAELALIENLQRKDLNAIEKALSFQNYLTQHKCSQEELAKRLNMDRSTISNFLRLLDLPDEIQKRIVEQKLTQGHARALLPLVATEDQLAMCDRIVDEKLSVRQVEQIVSDWNEAVSERGAFNLGGSGGFDETAETPKRSIREMPAAKKGGAKKGKEKSPQLLDLEQQLREALGLKVDLSADSSGKGTLAIHFRNHDEFESLMDYFRA
ncbi:MAG: ParB/RepB/Spo0J family partition protein [Planctomycetia bacterium]|nr:ParB/RepB/Spo0J family partition protein [Planctomycetia bacterium]